MMKNNLFKLISPVILKSYAAIIAFLLLHLCAAQAQNGPVCDTYTIVAAIIPTGLGSKTVNGVYASGNTIYAGSAGGLSISTDVGAAFTNKTITNGLGGNTNNGVFESSSTIYSAKRGGLSFCSPAPCTPTSSTETISACFSYLWHGTTYTASNSSATWTEVNAAGCDSVVTLNLTIKQPTASTEIIRSCGSYNWNGNTYTLGMDANAILALWTMPTAIPAATTGTSYSYGAADSGENTTGSSLVIVHSVSATTYLSPSGNGSTYSVSCNNWSSGDYYQTTVSTIGYTNITLTWDQTRNSTGPATFDLKMSIDGGSSFTTVLAGYTVIQAGLAGSGTTNWNTTTYQSQFTSNVNLGATAANKSSVILRFVSTVTSAATATNRIDNISIQGNQCVNPTSGGSIAADQSGTSPFDPATFTSTVAASGQSGTLEYKWQSSTTSTTTGFTDISSSNTDTYDAGSLTVTTWYRRLARVSCSADWTGAVASNVLEVTVTACINPTSGGSIAADQSGTSPFDPAAFTSTVAASGETGILEYKWQSSITSSSAGFTDIASSNAAAYDAPALTQTTWFKRLARVDCESNWTGAAESNVLEVTDATNGPACDTYTNKTTADGLGSYQVYGVYA